MIQKNPDILDLLPTQMVANKGDEFHGIESVEKSPTKQIEKWDLTLQVGWHKWMDPRWFS